MAIIFHSAILLGAFLLVSPSPRPLHQRVVARMRAALTPGCPKAFEVLPAPVDVVLAEGHGVSSRSASGNATGSANATPPL